MTWTFAGIGIRELGIWGCRLSALGVCCVCDFGMYVLELQAVEGSGVGGSVEGCVGARIRARLGGVGFISSRV